MTVVKTLAALGAAVVVTACEVPTASTDSRAQDNTILAAVSVEVGALGEYLSPSVAQLRTQYGDSTAHARCAELERLRLELQDRVRAGDQAGASQARSRLRLAAAEMIRAGLGDGPLAGLLAQCDSLLERLRARTQERERVGQDTAADQQQFRSMLELREQVRTAQDAGRHAEALELAARIREQLRTQLG